MIEWALYSLAAYGAITLLERIVRAVVFVRGGYQPAPGNLGTPPRASSAVYRGNIPPAPPPRPEGAPYPARPSR